MVKAFRFLTLGVLAIPIMLAQKPSPPLATPGTGPMPPSTTTPPADNATTPLPGSQLPLVLFGGVVVEGGGELPSNIKIQRFCGNLTHTVAWADAKGQFSFQWNSNNGVAFEASDSEPNSTGFSNRRSTDPQATANRTNAQKLQGTNLQGSNLLNCELQASASGFRSDRIALTGLRALDNTDVGLIVLHRVRRARGVSVSATELGAPKDARKAWERGVSLLRSGQIEDQAEAEKKFEKAVRIDPGFAAAWVSLGFARERRLAEEKACEAFRKALAADGRQAEALIELGLVASRHQRWPEAAQYLDRALKLNPIDYPQLWYDDALASYHVGNLDRAEKNVREAIRMASLHPAPGATRLLGLVLMSKREWRGAEAAVAAYLRDAPEIEDWVMMQAALEDIRGHIKAGE
jgi:tetratricopeptide (TPR) repeat protein